MERKERTKKSEGDQGKDENNDIITTHGSSNVHPHTTSK